MFENIKKVVPEDIVFCCLYGSRVYGTNDDDSDCDIVCVVKEVNEAIEEYQVKDVFIDGKKCDISVTPLVKFIKELENNEVWAIEQLFSPVVYFEVDDFKIVRQNFKIDKDSLRKSFSTKADNSEVKARKKVIDGEIYLGKKSLFHCYRIYKFAVVLGEKGHLDQTDFSCANDFYKEVIACNGSVEEFKRLYKLWIKDSGLMKKYKELFPKN